MIVVYGLGVQMKIRRRVDLIFGSEMEKPGGVCTARVQIDLAYHYYPVKNLRTKIRKRA